MQNGVVTVEPPVTRRPPQVSRPKELPPRPLLEPDVNLSIHPAPITQPHRAMPAFQCANNCGSRILIHFTQSDARC